MRLFIALPIRPREKSLIEHGTKPALKLLNQRFNLNLKPVPPENWHLTLIFLGEQSISGLTKIQQAISAAADMFSAPNVALDKLEYGPNQIRPRILWLKGNQRSNVSLQKIKSALAQKLAKNKINWQKDNRLFRAHLTLARFNPVPISQLPKVDRNFNLLFPAQELILVQSTLARGGAKYQTLAKFKFSASPSPCLSPD